MFTRLWNRARVLDLSRWEKQLADAKKALYTADVPTAMSIFPNLSRELASVNGSSDRLHQLRLMAALGNWAVAYLKDPARRGEYETILAAQEITPEVWQFLANVFSLTKDSTDEAARAYGALFDINPRDILAAQLTFKLIRNSSPSIRKFALLGKIARTLSSDADVLGLICRWAIWLNIRDAPEWGEAALAKNPNNIDANRMMGWIAERENRWKTATVHYLRSGDWLRCFVTCCRAGDLVGAEYAADQVPANQRSSETYLYFAGWLANQGGRTEACLANWRKLSGQTGNVPLRTQFSAVAQETLYQHLQALEIGQSDIALADEIGIYRKETRLACGLAKLLIDHNADVARSVMEDAAELVPTAALVAQVLIACRMFSSQQTDLTAAHGSQTLDLGANLPMAHWLCGVAWLGRDAAVAVQHIAASLSSRNQLSPLSDQVLSATAWAAATKSQSTDPQLKAWADQMPGTLVQMGTAKAGISDPLMLTAYVAQNLPDGQELEKLLSADPKIASGNSQWVNVLATYYAAASHWARAFEILDSNGDQSSEVLFLAVLLRATRDAIANHDWASASTWCIRLLALESNDRNTTQFIRRLFALLPFQLWATQNYEPLRDLLSYRLKTTSRWTGSLHHSLALVYTRLGLKSADSDAWQKAVGHWAAILTDELYWKQWRDNRRVVYEIEIAADKMAELRQTTLPQMIRRQLEDLIADSSGDDVLPLRQFRARVLSEPDATQAVRYGLKQLAHRSIQAPAPVEQLISPLLVQGYGYTAQGNQFSEIIQAQKLSPHETSLIVRAFSPLATVYALTEAKDYSTALEMLTDLDQLSDLANGRQQEAHGERKRVLLLLLAALVEAGNWQEAITRATSALQAEPANRELEALLIKAEIGAATQQLQGENYQAAVVALRNRRAKASRVYPDLNTTLAEALARWGSQAMPEDTNIALTRFTEALNVSSTNALARQGAAGIHMERALEKAKQNQFKAAEQEAQQALALDDDPRIRSLLGLIYGSLAQESARNDLWDKASSYAGDAVKYGNNADAMQLYIQVTLGHIGYLGSRYNYSEAIQMATSLQKMNLNFRQLGVNANLDQILSELHNNWGVVLSRAGNYVGARQQYRIAMRYDPNNYTARRNLGQSGG